MNEIIACPAGRPLDLQAASTSVLAGLARGGVEDARRLLFLRIARRPPK